MSCKALRSYTHVMNFKHVSSLTEFSGTTHVLKMKQMPKSLLDWDLTLKNRTESMQHHFFHEFPDTTLLNWCHYCFVMLSDCDYKDFSACLWRFILCHRHIPLVPEPSVRRHSVEGLCNDHQAASILLFHCHFARQ